MDDDAAREARDTARYGPWSTEGWAPRKKQRRITTDRTRAERIALGHEARRLNLGQEIRRNIELHEERAALRSRYDTALSWVNRAALDLEEAADARKGRHRTRQLDRAIDGMIAALEEAWRELYPGDDEDD